MVNAIPHQLNKRTTEFGKCPFDIVPPVIGSVAFSPDPAVSEKDVQFTINGKFGKDITSDTQIDIVFLDADDVPIGDVFTETYCTKDNGIVCPITAGTATTRTSTVKAPELPDPNSYTIVVNIYDDGDVTDSIACSWSGASGAESTSNNISSTYFS